jgi:hypothetical protein
MLFGRSFQKCLKEDRSESSGGAVSYSNSSQSALADDSGLSNLKHFFQFIPSYSAVKFKSVISPVTLTACGVKV